MFTAISTLPLNQHQSKKINFLVSLSTLCGVIISILFNPYLNDTIITSFIGFVIGVLVFTVMRHSIPMGSEGKPLYFILGIIVYSPFIVLEWLI
jgi:hypothetical protein